MKKNIVLSFHPDYFRPIIYGLKKYEYRKSFCNEPVTAYLYLTKPISEFVGIMELGKRVSPEYIKEILPQEEGVAERMNVCITEKEKAIIPIISFELFKNPVPLDEIKRHVVDFKVPRAFQYIDDCELLNFLQDQDGLGVEFIHDHSSIFKDNVGLKCIDIEKSDKFKKYDRAFIQSDKASLVKTGYLLKTD